MQLDIEDYIESQGGRRGGVTRQVFFSCVRKAWSAQFAGTMAEFEEDLWHYLKESNIKITLDNPE